MYSSATNRTVLYPYCNRKLRNREWNLSSALCSNNITAECLIKLGEGEISLFSSICGPATSITEDSVSEMVMNPGKFLSILTGIRKFGLTHLVV